MNVQFREIDPFNCWIWLRFAEPPTKGEMNYVDGILDSWYVIGRLGGFNSENLQAHEGDADLNWMPYENKSADSLLPSLMHNLGEIEYQNNWARFWVDLGTSDPLAIDVLINTFYQLDSDLVQLEEVLIGGFNEEWPVDDHPDAIFK